MTDVYAGLTEDARLLFLMLKDFAERMKTAALADWERETIADELEVLADRVRQGG